MHCLLCHEKIPRLRAWTGKSEFCCDEHADLYKKQTMDRLLVDDSVGQGAPAALPIPDLNAQPPAPVATSVDHVLLKDQSHKSKSASQEQEDDNVDELWKLAERMGSSKEKARPSGIQLPGISEVPPLQVEAQSAEDALAALQALAAQASERDTAADGDLLDEFSSLESSFEELPQLEALPVDLATELDDAELEEAPEFELDALELGDEQSEPVAGPELVAQPTELDSMDAPDLVIEGLDADEQESLEPPDLATTFADEQPEFLEPPELAAEFAAEQTESLEPPDAALEELLAEPQDADLAEPPEPQEFEVAAAEEGVQAQAAAPVARRAPKVAPKMRPATELHEMSPTPTFPEGSYALKPWSDALAVAGPDRGSLLSPLKFTELRKSSLNGTASAKFDPVRYQASERAASVKVPIFEPEPSGVSLSSENGALRPRDEVAWPEPLHAVLVAAEMNLSSASRGMSAGEDAFSVKQPALSTEFLSAVVLESRIMEPRSAAILTPRERDVFASGAAEEEVSDGGSASDRDETDGGERAHVADLF